MTRVFTANSDPHLLALNLPHLTTVLACFGAVVGILSMVWAASIWGLVGAAWATSVTAAFQLLLNYAIIWRAAGISPAVVGTAIWRSVAACLAMAGVVLPLLQLWPRADTTFSLFLELCCACVLGALVYVAVHLVLWRFCGMPASAEKHALQAVSSLVTRLAPRRAKDRG
jgi:O-antigen/teichoic acid export membrane protein